MLYKIYIHAELIRILLKKVKNENFDLKLKYYN
jgi:hypothetical protein